MAIRNAAPADSPPATSPDVQRALAQALTLARLSGAVARASTSAEVGRIMLDEIARATSAEVTELAVIDEAAQEFEVIAVREAGRILPGRERWPLDLPSPARDVVRSGGLVLVDRAEYDARYPGIGEARDRGGLAAYLAVPIVAGARAIGALGFWFEHGVDLGPVELDHLQALVDAGAQALARARLEDGERRSRALVKAVVDQMPLGVRVLGSAPGRTLYANDAYYHIFGLSREEAADHRNVPLLRMDGSLLPEAERPLTRALAGEVVTDELCMFEYPDGRRTTISISAGPVRDDSGAVMGGLGVYVDVGSRVAGEAAREAFLGVLSHELRTPITSIYGGAAMVARRIEEPVVREIAQGVADEADRLYRLVEDLLVLSRVERGADLRRDDPVLLHHVIRRTVAFEQDRWPHRALEVSVPSTLPVVGGDEGYVEQILKNLLTNALKYAPADRPIEIAADHADGEVRVRVLDRGPGIEPEAERRIFELFYRAPSTSVSAPGAGIGLYAVRALAEAMGGRVWARRREGGGAEVGFALRTLDVGRADDGGNGADGEPSGEVRS